MASVGRNQIVEKERRQTRTNSHFSALELQELSDGELLEWFSHMRKEGNRSARRLIEKEMKKRRISFTEE